MVSESAGSNWMKLRHKGSLLEPLVSVIIWNLTNRTSSIDDFEYEIIGKAFQMTQFTTRLSDIKIRQIMNFIIKKNTKTSFCQLNRSYNASHMLKVVDMFAPLRNFATLYTIPSWIYVIHRFPHRRLTKTKKQFYDIIEFDLLIFFSFKKKVLNSMVNLLLVLNFIIIVTFVDLILNQHIYLKESIITLSNLT